MANTRHVVVMRKDLNMPVGLACAQAAHICDSFQRHVLIEDGNVPPYVKEWLREPYLSVLAVAGKDELEYIIDQADAAELAVHKWYDNIPSENLRKPMHVLVGCSIGPADFDKINLVTGTLPLY
jgi:peptidyl-tRNA hydrolase